jgi:hypothetical protein
MERMELSRLLCKQGVTGSIPVTSPNILLSFCKSRLVGAPKFALKLYVVRHTASSSPASNSPLRNCPARRFPPYYIESQAQHGGCARFESQCRR